MAKYEISEQARHDLDAIWDYIRRDNPKAANRVEDQIVEAYEKLAEYPHMGHKREDLTPRPLRFWGIHSYIIVYKPDVKPLEILRILSGYRDIAGFL